MSYDLTFKFVLIIPLPHDNAILILAYGGNSILVCEDTRLLAFVLWNKKIACGSDFRQSKRTENRTIACGSDCRHLETAEL